MSFIAVQNASTKVTEEQLQLMTRAVAQQVRKDVAPEWGTKQLAVVYLKPDAVIPPGAWVITVFDTADQADALGYHTEDPNGTVYGKVFAGPVLDNGGTVMDGAISVSAVLSHEVLETYMDPRVQLWASDNSGTTQWAYEICDPVEDSAYQVAVGGQVVSVSNFVLPEWFDATPPAGSVFDHMAPLDAPFTIASGGYAVTLQAGQLAETYGDRFPAWKVPGKLHALSRKARRHA